MRFSVTPANAGIYNVAGGDGAVTTQQFTAIGTYANGATNTLTNAVWTSSNTSIATVSSTGLAKATGTAAGTLTITASSGGTSGYATLSVSYNSDLGGGIECGGDDDCDANECCLNGSCTVCGEQGEGRKNLIKQIEKVDHRF
ncbi:MAG: Ig-like domain-containing protein [Candidatus Sulfotelmatobacter sp.]